ncbi:MAG: hypothetical protein KA781_03865 [Aquabacterium sp.]|nr:hypothetical protein [Aquabacterium sp.]
MITRDSVVTTCAMMGMSGMLLGLLMMFATRAYLNRSSRRSRIIELIRGPHNEWHNGKPFDFVVANFIIPSSTFTAWRMKNGFITQRQRRAGSFAFPALHQNKNYTALLNEFSAFAAWEAAKAIILFASISALILGMGLDKGWW